MVRRKNCVSDSESDVMESGSSIPLSSRSDESGDFKLAEQEVTQNENDFQTLSPMSTSDEESVYKSELRKYKWNKCCYDSKSKIVLLNRKLRDELNRASDKVIQLENAKSALRNKLNGIEMARSAEDSRMKDKLDSLQELIQERDRQVKELWYVVQMLDDENMLLKSQSEKFEDRESQLNKEIIDLKVSSASGAHVAVSGNAADWKEVLDQDLSSLKTKNPKAGKKPSNSKTSGRRERWRQSSVKLPLKQIHRKLIKITSSDAMKSTCDQGRAKETSSAKLASESKMPEQRATKKVHNDKARTHISDWSNEEASRDSKSSTWGSGLWPPEWTTVSKVAQQKSWCEVVRAKE